jgi:predicted ribosomally synthesized peptide with SipW-like signal peptide
MQGWGAACVALAIGAGAAYAAFTQVEKSVRVDKTGTTCPGARFSRIQDALDAAAPGAKIIVCPGVYPEQLLVARAVRLRGMRGAVVRPSGMTANTTSIRTGRPIAAVAVVTARASIDGLDFDASEHGLTGCDEDDPLVVGVYLRGAGARLRGSRVHGATFESVDPACDNGVGVLAQANGARTLVTIADTLVFDYQRSGIIANEAGLRATIRGNTVTGSGPTPAIAQNGIQVGFGAAGKVIRNIVQNNAAPSGGCTFDGGNLVYESDGGSILGNVFTGNTAGVIVKGSRNRIARNTVDGLSGGTPVGLDGVSVIGNRILVLQNSLLKFIDAFLLVV